MQTPIPPFPMTLDMAAVEVVLEGLAGLPVKRAGRLYFQLLDAANKHVAESKAVSVTAEDLNV